MRTGNLGSLSERDHAGRREFLAFLKEEAGKKRLSEDRVEYEKYSRIIEGEQQRVPPAHRIQPIPFEAWRTYADPAITDPVIRGAQATNKALLCKVSSDEAAEVKAGKPDPAFEMPDNAKGLRMSVEKAMDYARKQSELFVAHNSEYFPSPANVAAITKYLTEQGVTIPTEECLKAAWLRLRELGMIEEWPVPETEPAVTEPEEPQPDPEELRRQRQHQYRTQVVVTDPRTGQDYTEYQLDRLPADEYKRLMIGEFRTPRITDVIRPAWFSAK